MEKTCRILLTTETKKPSSVDEFLVSHYMQRRQFLDTMYMSYHYMYRQEGWIFNVKRVLSLWSYYFEILKDKNSFLGDPEKLLDPETVTSILETEETSHAIKSVATSPPHHISMANGSLPRSN